MGEFVTESSALGTVLKVATTENATERVCDSVTAARSSPEDLWKGTPQAPGSRS